MDISKLRTLTFLDLQNRYGTHFDYGSVQEKLAYSPSRAIDLYFDLVLRDSEFVNQKFNLLRPKIISDVTEPLKRILSLHDLPLPSFCVSNSVPEAAFFFDDRPMIILNPIFLLESLVDSFDVGVFRHEFGHYIQSFANSSFNLLDPFSRRFDFGYPRGSFLEGSVFQTEGFAEWCRLGKTKFPFKHEAIRNKSWLFFDPWKRLCYLRENFENPYVFGPMVYDLVQRVDDIDGVKKLAFEQKMNRAGMETIYFEVCGRLRIKPLLPEPRKKKLIDVYDELRNFEQIPKDYDLVNNLREIDLVIQDQIDRGIEPKIFTHSNRSNTLFNRVLAECYWHHGITFSSEVNSKLPSAANCKYVGYNPMKQARMNNQWTIFIAQEEIRLL